MIKLCKPEMEVNTDSLLDRIRSLEEKMEQGIRVMPSEELPAVNTVNPLKTEAPRVLPKALREEVRQVVEKWPGIVGNAPMPLKSYLKKVRLSLGEKDQLLMVVEDGIAYDYLAKAEGNRQMVLELIENYLGKTLEMEFRPLEENRQFETSFVDLSKIINMEIEEE